MNRFFKVEPLPATFQRNNGLRLLSRLLLLAVAVAGALLWLGLGGAWLERATLTSPRTARATGGLSGVITHTTLADFGQACTVLPDVRANPVFTNVNVISTAGGELRLIPTLADYFDGVSVNGALWRSGPVRDWFSVPITVSNGIVTLNANYLRSQNAFSQSVRFFEARALLRPDPNSLPGWPDVGYMREGQQVGDTYQPAQPATADTGSRVFIARGDYSQLEFWARDGVESNPLIVENLGDPGLDQWRVFGIEWDVDTNTTRVYLDDNLQRTLTATSVITSWAWLYHPSPNQNPIQVDWVRAGQYPLGGGYLSCVQDAGGVVNWSQFEVSATTPGSTSLAYRTRTSLNGTTWSNWSDPLTSTLITSPSGRYLQYQVEFSNTTPLRSPELQQVVLRSFGPTLLQISPNPAILDPGAEQQFTAQAFDNNNRPVMGLTYIWQLPAGGGVLDATGLFTAGLPAGTFVNAITATTPVTGGGPLVGYSTVTVRDLPPTANANGPYFTNQGAELTHNGSGNDPNGGPPSFAWDLNNDSIFERPGQSITNTWLGVGVFTIGLIVTDTGGFTTTVTTTVTVNNVAPTINSVTGSPATVNQGELVTVTVTATDPGGASDPLTYAFDCDDDGTYEIGPQSSNQAACLMRPAGLRTIRVRVSDSNGASVPGTTTVAVTNVAPTIVSVTRSPATVNQGELVTVTVTATDPGGASDPLTYAFDCDNDGTYEIGPQSSNQAACTMRPAGPSRTIRVRVSDSNGAPVTGTTTVTVTNVAPAIVSLANNGPIVEGSSVTITLTATDPGGASDPLTYAFDCNNDGNYEIGPQSGNSTACFFGDNGVYTVRARVADSDGGAANATTEVTVTNVAPTIVSLTNNGPRLPNDSVTIRVTATDPAGANDPLQYEFDCDGDNVYEIGPQAEFTATCVYTALGDYTVKVRVNDGDGGVATGSTPVSIVSVLRLFLPLIVR